MEVLCRSSLGRCSLIQLTLGFQSKPCQPDEYQGSGEDSAQTHETLPLPSFFKFFLFFYGQKPRALLWPPHPQPRWGKNWPAALLKVSRLGPRRPPNKISSKPVIREQLVANQHIWLTIVWEAIIQHKTVVEKLAIACLLWRVLKNIPLKNTLYQENTFCVLIWIQVGPWSAMSLCCAIHRDSRLTAARLLVSSDKGERGKYKLFWKKRTASTQKLISQIQGGAAFLLLLVNLLMEKIM